MKTSTAVSSKSVTAMRFAVVCIMSASVLQAQKDTSSPWQGTWTLVDRESHFATESLRIDKEPDGSFTVRNDGRAPLHLMPRMWPYKDAATGLEYFVSLDGNRGFEARVSRGDQHVFDLGASISADGKTLTEDRTEWKNHDLAYRDRVDYTRVSGSGFFGSWQTRNPYTGDPPRTFSVQKDASDAFHLELPGHSRFFSVVPGGPASTILSIKTPTTSIVSLTRENTSTLHWKYGDIRKMLVEGRANLSADGRTIHFESWPLGRPEARSVAMYTRQR